MASPLAALVSVVTHGFMMAPGILAFWRAAPGNWLIASTMGPVLGVGASSTVMLGLWALGFRGLWMMGVSPLLAAVAAWQMGRLRDRWRLPAAAPRETTAWLALLLLVPLLVAVPFRHVGQVRPEGQVYRAYFTADYVWRRALVAEIAKGDFPPKNPYYLYDELHYYWLGHLPDAIEYRALSDRAELDDLLLATSVVVDATFVSLIYGLARLVVAVPWAAAAGVAWAFLFTSFEGVAALWHIRSGRPPIIGWREFNIDAVSRWIYGGMPIDGLHRVLWYQPHHAMAYALGLDRPRPRGH